MAEKKTVTNETLDQILLSLADSEEEEPSRTEPPVINTFRLRMEAERRRNRRQVQIVTIAAWFSVTSTLALLSYFAFVLLPEIEKNFTPQTKHFILTLRQSLSAYESLFYAFGIAMILGYVFSAVLLIAKRDLFFTKNT